MGLALWSLFAFCWSVLAVVYLAQGEVGFAIVGLIVAVGSWVVLVLRLRQETSRFG